MGTHMNIYVRNILLLQRIQTEFDLIDEHEHASGGCELLWILNKKCLHSG